MYKSYKSCVDSLLPGGDHAGVLHVPESDVDHEAGQLEGGVVLRLGLARAKHRVRPPKPAR